MEYDEVDDEELEDAVDDDAHQTVLWMWLNFRVQTFHCKNHYHDQLKLLHPEVGEKVLSVALADAVSEPGTVVVVSRDTFLAQSAVSSSERHIYEALGAVPERDLNLSCFVASLDSVEVLVVVGSVLLLTKSPIWTVGCILSLWLWDNMLTLTLAHLTSVLNWDDIVFEVALAGGISCQISADQRYWIPNGIVIDDGSLILQRLEGRVCSSLVSRGWLLQLSVTFLILINVFAHVEILKLLGVWIGLWIVGWNIELIWGTRLTTVWSNLVLILKSVQLQWWVSSVVSCHNFNLGRVLIDYFGVSCSLKSFYTRPIVHGVSKLLVVG